jgi:hypothetical protein
MNDYTNTILRWLSWSPSRYGSWFDSREGNGDLMVALREEWERLIGLGWLSR